jgi:hypothetical protein
MKRVKIANGIRKIDDSDTNACLLKLRDVLSEHRTLLINRLVSDLASYIDYKFHIKATAKQIESVKENLQILKNSTFDLDKYTEIVEHFFHHDLTYIGTELFFKEIDENISSTLNASQLKLVEY